MSATLFGAILIAFGHVLMRRAGDAGLATREDTFLCCPTKQEGFLVLVEWQRPFGHQAKRTAILARRSAPPTRLKPAIIIPIAIACLVRSTMRELELAERRVLPPVDVVVGNERVWYIFAGGPTATDGHIDDLPGLGLEVDEAALAKFEVTE